jgi:hypothetical protein
MAEACGPAQQPETPQPSFANIVMTDLPKTKTPKTTFKPDTAEIFVFFDLEHIKGGSEIKGVWICEEAKDIPPEFTIDEASVKVDNRMNMGEFSLVKPNNDWPIGKYRVELYVGESMIDSVKFKIAP